MTEAQKLKLIDGWEVVIGIEIHTQLATKSKIFSGSSTEFGQDPNTQASLVDLAMPGVLPVLNAEVVDLAIRFGLGIDAYIDQASVFARKNYFYPDLPKGYQITQDTTPICTNGQIIIPTEEGKEKSPHKTQDGAEAQTETPPLDNKLYWQQSRHLWIKQRVEAPTIAT